MNPNHPPTTAFKKFLKKHAATYTPANTLSDALADFTMKLETEDTFSTLGNVRKIVPDTQGSGKEKEKRLEPKG